MQFSLELMWSLQQLLHHPQQASREYFQGVPIEFAREKEVRKQSRNHVLDIIVVRSNTHETGIMNPVVTFVQAKYDQAIVCG
jgi:hypothetical protein